MRRLLTSGIKAVIAIAALSTAAHWAMRIQREPASQPAPLAASADPAATGSIVPHRVDEVSDTHPVDVTRGLDQKRLSELISGASFERSRGQKAVTRQ